MDISPLFEFLHVYSRDFGDYLAGLDSSCENFTGTDYYFTSFFTILGFSFASSLVFYFPGSSSRKTKHWFLWGAFMSFVAAILIFFLIRHDLNSKPICEELFLSSNDLLAFSFIIFLYTLMLYVIFSLIMKNFSTHGMKTPF